MNLSTEEEKLFKIREYWSDLTVKPDARQCREEGNVTLIS